MITPKPQQIHDDRNVVGQAFLNSVRANGTNWAQGEIRNFLPGNQLIVRLNPDMPFHRVYVGAQIFAANTGAAVVGVNAEYRCEVKLERDGSAIHKMDFGQVRNATTLLAQTRIAPGINLTTSTGALSSEQLAVTYGGVQGRFQLTPWHLFGFADKFVVTFESTALAAFDTNNTIMFVGIKSTPVMIPAWPVGFFDSFSQSESFVSTTTNTITDSYNQAWSRVENLSDVGNVTVYQGDGAGGAPSTGMILILALAALAALWLMKKGKLKA